MLFRRIGSSFRTIKREDESVHINGVLHYQKLLRHCIVRCNGLPVSTLLANLSSIGINGNSLVSITYTFV